MLHRVLTRQGKIVQQTSASPRHVWIPHLTPTPDHCIPHIVFRSPAIIVDGTVFIPDLPTRDVWLDYDHQAHTVTFAAGTFHEEGHVFYLRGEERDAPLRLHRLDSRARKDRLNPYGMAARWLWNRYGHAGHEAAPRLPVGALCQHIVRWAFESWEDVWQDVNDTAGAPVFIVDVARHPGVPVEKRTWREPRAIWNQAWFSTQRCANGLLRYARQTKNADLERRAHKMTEVALLAPQTDGLFPSVLRHWGGGWEWINSDRRPRAATPDTIHVLDAAFTCRMLLEWNELAPDPRIDAYVGRFVDRLLRLQRPNGSLPGWIDVEELSEGPESAVAATLLFTVGHHAEALRTLEFLEGIAETGRWEDFETYYSCAPWGTPGKRVERNGVYKQNTLSIFWCAEAFFAGWRATKARRWLRLARRCLDELSLYQAVWSPDWLPTTAHGGFGVMNGDCEWNDARQSLFAPLYFEIGTAMNDRELIERGISAVRASFSMLYCPENPALKPRYEARHPFFGPESYGFMMENQGHMSGDPIGVFTIYTWGNGSALATAALVRDRFPEIAASYEQ